MSFVVIAVLIVLTALAVGYVGLLLEEHAEWREWHVPRGGDGRFPSRRIHRGTAASSL